MAENQTEVKEAEGTSAKTLTEEARTVNKELKETLAAIKAERQAMDEIRAKEILGGRSEAGAAPVKPKEETPKEYAERIMGGKSKI
jgi:hypothetical protein